MHFVEIDGRRYAQFDRLRKLKGLAHAFATRPIDVSARTDTRSPERAARRAQMAADFRFDPARLCHCIQVHETTVDVVGDTISRGAFEARDGLVTDRPGVALMTFSADCPLVLAFDSRRNVVGMAHASWRCTVGRTVQRLIATMMARFGCRAGDICAGIGPSAGPCCYEVKDDVRAAARDLPRQPAAGDAGDSLFPRRDGRMFFDLWQANVLQLRESGLSPEQIELAGACTMCRNDLFYSFRREGAGCGHFGLLAGLPSR